MNFDFDPLVRSFSVPLPAGAAVANVGFRDADEDPSNDWGASTAGGAVTWSAPKSLGGQDYSTLFNFRFDANASPSAANGVTVRLRATEVRDWEPTLAIVGPGKLTAK
jgi:hypothetical protein